LDHTDGIDHPDARATVIIVNMVPITVGSHATGCG